jgi:hypothetical protein
LQSFVNADGIADIAEQIEGECNGTDLDDLVATMV